MVKEKKPKYGESALQDDKKVSKGGRLRGGSRKKFNEEELEKIRERNRRIWTNPENPNYDIPEFIKI